MKTIRFVACATLLFWSLPSFAVRVKDCPAAITVKIPKVTGVSDQKLLDQVSDQNFEGLRRRILAALNDARSKLPVGDESENVSLTYTLYRTENSQCGYQLEGQPVQPGPHAHRLGETRFYTQNSRDILRIAKIWNNELFWIWINIEGYSVDGLTVADKDFASIRGYFPRGEAPHYVLGWAKNLAVK